MNLFSDDWFSHINYCGAGLQYGCVSGFKSTVISKKSLKNRQVKQGGARRKATMVSQQEDMFCGTAQSFSAEQSRINALQKKKRPPMKPCVTS